MCAPQLRRDQDIEDVVHRVGGHSGGMQAVRVRTPRDWGVLASDAPHCYFNRLQKVIFPSICRIDEMIEAHRTLHRLAGGDGTKVIPGHRW